MGPRRRAVLGQRVHIGSRTEQQGDAASMSAARGAVQGRLHRGIGQGGTRIDGHASLDEESAEESLVAAACRLAHGFTQDLARETRGLLLPTRRGGVETLSFPTGARRGADGSASNVRPRGSEGEAAPGEGPARLQVVACRTEAEREGTVRAGGRGGSSCAGRLSAGRPRSAS